jgi:hypothetical protein
VQEEEMQVTFANFTVPFGWLSNLADLILTYDEGSLHFDKNLPTSYQKLFIELHVNQRIGLHRRQSRGSVSAIKNPDILEKSLTVACKSSRQKNVGETMEVDRENFDLN